MWRNLVSALILLSLLKLWPCAGSQLLEYVESAEQIILSNGLVDLKLGKPGSHGGGGIQGISLHRADGKYLDLLDLDLRLDSRAYWDMHWEYGSSLSGHEHNAKCKFGDNNGALRSSSVEAGDEFQTLGVTFKQESSTQLRKHPRAPLNTIVHYTVKEGLSGVYCTLQADHTSFHPALQVTELRLVLKLDPKVFDYSFVADDRQRFMPTRLDISKHRSAALAFKEARILTKPHNKSLRYEVDHKYQYSVEAKDGALHGWISSKKKIGVWIISPNKWEYLGGGPNKQDLTVQTGPNLLAMLHSTHYGTPAIDLESFERWKKVYGPFLIYINEGKTVKSLIDDAKRRAAHEESLWPHSWVPFSHYAKSESRATITGHVVIEDALQGNVSIAANTWIGLSDEGFSSSSWEDEVKGYQFWNMTDAYGVFVINNVRPGTYLLQSLVRGHLTDSSVLQTVTVTPNSVTNLEEISLRLNQKGATLWEIGIPDRSAAEFMIPVSNSSKEGFRHYGVWNKFAELYPAMDPVYKIGKSEWAKDWFFAHVNRPNRTTTQREIQFELDRIVDGDYTLRLVIAGAHQAALEVRLNNPSGSPLHDTGPFGKDNALARGGIHGHYHEFSISLSHMNFHTGPNSIFLRQRKNKNKFSYVMYDYIRLESPATR